MIKNVPYRKGQSKARHYIDKDELDAIVRRCLENDRTPSNELAASWYQIMDHMLQASNFAFYSDEVKNDMKSYAIMKLMRSMKSIDMSKCKSSFGYFTRIIYLAFITELGMQKRERDKINSIKEKFNDQLKRLAK